VFSVINSPHAEDVDWEDSTVVDGLALLDGGCEVSAYVEDDTTFGPELDDDTMFSPDEDKDTTYSPDEDD